MSSSAFSVNVERTRAPRPRPPADDLGFGRFFTDHQLSMRFEQGAWGPAEITPYGALSLDPAASVVQYAQSIFEGLKAYADPAGGPHRLFRADRHAARLNASARRLCLPEVPEATFVESIRALLRTDADWMPSAEDTSIYVRPTLVGNEGFLGVRPAKSALFFVILSPVGSYWQGARRPLRLWVEQEFVRAAPGGTGAAKTGGNYAASLLAAERAKERGFDQVLWLDGAERRYVEEVGTMNFFARIGDTVITPPLDGTILPGVTRECVLTVLGEWGVRTEERRMTLQEIVEAGSKGTLREMFGTGTAGIVAPVGELGGGSTKVTVADGREGELTTRLYEEIRGIQAGKRPDRHGWLRPIE
jgi:branched-chain amino acid aminotransferase